MELKKILRSALAILCCVSLVLGSFAMMMMPEAKAAESLPIDFTEVTPEDFGIADISDNAAKTLYPSTKKPVQTADKMLFSTNILFGDDGGRGIYLFDSTGTGSSGKGLCLWISCAAEMSTASKPAASFMVAFANARI